MSDKSPTSQGDMSTQIAWGILKAPVILLRLWWGGVCTIAALALPFQILAHPSWDGVGEWLIVVVMAFVIWPQKYGPPTSLILAWQKHKTQDETNKPN